MSSMRDLHVEKVVDTTGCGDLFHTGFAVRWLETHDLLDCQRFAAAMAMEFHLLTFWAAFFSSSFTTAFLVATGTIRYAPSSTAFWMMSSILSLFGRP